MPTTQSVAVHVPLAKDDMVFAITARFPINTSGSANNVDKMVSELTRAANDIAQRYHTETRV